MRTILLFIMALTLISCATAYKPKDASGGYYDYAGSEENEYIVGFIGNRHTKFETVQEYAHRHALELCKEKGLSSYEIVKNKEKVKMKKSKTQLTIRCK